MVPPLPPTQPVTPNQRLRILGEGRLLQIQPTRVSDSGRYLCVASNVAGEDDQDFSVLIQGVWGPVGLGRWDSWGWEASMLLEQSGRKTLFLLASSLSLCWLACLTSRPLALAWALPLTDFVTWGLHCPPDRPWFYLRQVWLIRSGRLEGPHHF